VKLLLDTHVVLWWRLDSACLKAQVRKRIASAEIVWVSAASGWEVAIKQSLGRLKLTESFSSMVADSQFDELPITLRHAEQITSLPAYHADPFDRMLVAQAQVEGATVVSHDRQFEGYDVTMLWV
jgi:PIN domain nuclease of toxin-antitoxin system